MPSYVLIWEQNMYGQKKVSGHTWPGHSAMNIGDHFDPPLPDFDSLTDEIAFRQNLVHNYVSWWPYYGANFGIRDFLSSKKQRGSTGYSVASDIIVETYLPDHVIKLDSTSAAETAMQGEWNAIRTKQGASYGQLRKNCSTIVSRVLHAGGYLGHKWALDNNWVWTPSDIRKLAEAAGGTRMKWKDFKAILSKAGYLMHTYNNIGTARSGKYCSTGVPCLYQNNKACAV